MEEDIDKKINNFEKILKTYCGSKSLLYRDKINENLESQGLRSEDVIKNISKQIKALNHNEALSKTVNNKLKTYKDSRLTSINMLSLELEPQQKHPVGSNFENQCGFDSQLIVLTKDAEAIKDLHTGVTQEFETSFDQKLEIIDSQSKINSNIDNQTCNTSAININVLSPYQILQDSVLNNCNLSHLGNEESKNEIGIDDCKLQDLVSEYDTISSSPILFSKNQKECMNNTSYLLESFEKFEAIAAPLVHENSDVEAVKKIINSKILHDNNQAQVTSEETQYEDKHYETASIHLSPILKLKTDQEEIMRHINCDFTNKDDFLDEDIIFSSDEKTENDYSEVEELPLTCALQTSFYEQEYDLDKTIYVGFQTASNKSIQVLTNSFTKAKSILNDCYKICKPIQSLSLSELVEVYDSATIEKKGDDKSQKTSFDTACGTKKNVFNSSIYNNDKEHKPLHFGNFDDSVLHKTNNAVICTQEQIKIDDYMMQEFEENMCINDNKLHTNSDVSKHTVISNRAEQFMLNDNTNAHSDYCNVLISTFDKEQNTRLEEKIIENLGIDDETMYQNNYERDKIQNQNVNVKNELLTGFKTASNKCINISKAALVKSKEILEEVNIESNLTTDNLDSKIVKNKKFQGFITASQKPIKISDKVYVESDKIFQNIQFPLVMNENQNYNKKETTENTQNNRQIFKIENNKIDTHPGFKTASNNSINVSKDALLKSKKFLQEFNFDNDIVINNKKELVSEKETYNLEELQLKTYYSHENNKVGSMKEENGGTKNSMQSLNEFSTFTDTSCLKNLTNTKRILDIGVDQEIEDKSRNKESIAYAGLTTASNKRPKICMESSIKSKNAIDNIICDLTNSTNAFQGFKTANNKPVKTSDEAIEKSKKLFQDINNSDSMIFQSHSKEASTSYYSNTLKDSFQGFKTASNNPVKISDEALEKSKKIFQDINDCDSVTSKANNEQASVLNCLKNTFQGFKTASYNPVKISDEALEKSKKIFQDINNCDSYTPKSNSKQPSVSNTLKNTFQGFKTACNNPVKISDEALEKSKKIFLDINNYDSVTSKTHSMEANVLDTFYNTFQGFKTASNNPVRISDEALEKSKKIFQDITNCDSVTLKSNSKQHSVSNTLKNTFQGFKTASNNPVKISDEALEKCKTIFEDIIVNSDNLPETKSIENASFNKIESANNTLSKEDLRKNQTVFEKTEHNLKTKIKQKVKDTYASMDTTPAKTNINMHEYERNIEARKCFVDENKTNITDVCNLINTEVINNFNETMLTEDFVNKSPSNKRSGSPILSCPRPKKIKTKFVHEPVLENSCQPIDKTNRFAFNAGYKKQKKYKLLDVYEMDKVTNAIQSYKEVNYDIHNISSLEFVGARNELSDSIWTLKNITNFFLESVNKTIIPNGWVNNHVKLITLKLISYEKRFPNCMQNVCTVNNIMDQLKYRYDRELYNVDRPALRKILEKDEVPSRRMVLQVLNKHKNGSNVTDTSNSAENIELLLTDGWYCVKATIDKLLAKLVCEGKITIGMKLVTHGAELLHCEQGVAPWEDTSSVRLKISGNSTRRAHWAAKLGFHGNGAILSYLTTVKPEGGKISQLRVIVTRVYPMLYVEKFDDGSTVTRSERLENLHQMKYEMERETMLEKIYEEVEKEFCMQASQCDSVDDDRKSLESGSQIYQLLKKSRDPAEFRAGLTHSQSKILQEYIDKRREISLQDLQSKVQSLLKKRGLNVTRNVVAMLKIRVADVYKQNVTKAVLTVWRPHESLLHLLREGTWLDIHNVVPTAVRYSEIQISAGKQSIFRKTSKVDDKMLNIARTFQRKCYLIQELTQNPYLTTDYNEVDTVGFVFDIEPSVKEFDCKKQLFQNVFLADANKKIICINFWGGLKKFGFDSILEVGQVVTCINLQKRSGNTRKNIPQYRATEFTYFTKTPKIDVCRKACEDLSKQFLSLDRRKFVQDCVILRKNCVNIKYGNIENISPYRFNNSDYNLSKNKIFINSPSGDPNLNLNGLDFDSTFQQSDATLSPKALLRKKEVNERIAKLQKYGEPPPLGTIHIVNKSRDAVKPYRSPLISKAESSIPAKSDQLVAVKPQTVSTSAVDDPGDENIIDNRCTSPVLPFKRRTVNPVRLNFSNQKNASKDDPFGEDFETSPPLSLD